MATKKKELLEQDAPVTETVMSESETLLVDTAQPESLPADAGDGLDLNELLGLMDQPQQDTSGEDMNEDPLPELTEEEMFGDAPAETDDQSAAPTDMPEDSDVQPPDVYEDNADALQEPPASPKPKRTSRKKKEAAAPEEPVSEEVPTETTVSADTAETLSIAEEPAVEPDVPAVEEVAAPAPIPSPPRRQPRPQRGEAPVLLQSCEILEYTGHGDIPGAYYAEPAGEVGDRAARCQFFPKDMDRQFATLAVVVCISHQFDEAER